MDDKRIRKGPANRVVIGEDFDIDAVTIIETAPDDDHVVAIKMSDVTGMPAIRLWGKVAAKAHKAVLKERQAVANRVSEMHSDVDEEPAVPVVPAVGETLVGLFCNRTLKEAILGDLAEKFEMRARERGARNARLWYWGQVARSFGPFALRWGRRLVELGDLRQLIGW